MLRMKKKGERGKAGQNRKSRRDKGSLVPAKVGTEGKNGSYVNSRDKDPSRVHQEGRWAKGGNASKVGPSPHRTQSTMASLSTTFPLRGRPRLPSGRDLP